MKAGLSEGLEVGVGLKLVDSTVKQHRYCDDPEGNGHPQAFINLNEI
jgi:hypothetical protein